MAKQEKEIVDNDKYDDILKKMDRTTQNLRSNIESVTKYIAEYINTDYYKRFKNLLNETTKEMDEVIVVLNKATAKCGFRPIVPNIEDKTYKIKNLFDEYFTAVHDIKNIYYAMVDGCDLLKYEPHLPKLAGKYYKLKYMQANYDELYDKTFGEAVYKKNKEKDRDDQIEKFKDEALVDYNNELEELRTHFKIVKVFTFAEICAGVTSNLLKYGQTFIRSELPYNTK